MRLPHFAVNARHLLCPPLALLMLSLACVPAIARDTTPDCPLKPVAIPLFDATPPSEVLQASPVSIEAMPDAGEIRDAAGIIVACSNASSQAVRYAVFTDRYLAALFTQDNPADQPAFERMIAAGAVPDHAPFVLNSVSGIEPLQQGRVAVTLHIATPAGDVADRVILARNEANTHWLIDELVSLSTLPPTP